MKLNIASIFLSCTAVAVAQDAATSTIAELAIGTEELSGLVSFVQAADLAETLSDPAAIFTVFAPTNDALTGVDPKYVTEPWKTHLTNILLYHVLDSEVFSTDVPEEGIVLTALSQDNFTATVNNTGVFLGTEFFSSQVTTANIDATNGVVHIVNTLFIPSWMSLTLLDIAMNGEGFGSVATFITQAGLEDEIAAEDRTIFAPSGDAFASIPADLIAQIANNQDLIGAILTHHIVEGVWSRASLTDGLELTTLDGETLTITNSEDSIMVGGSVISEFDFLATNGVSHVISTILTPPSLQNGTDTVTTAPGAPPVDSAPPAADDAPEVPTTSPVDPPVAVPPTDGTPDVPTTSPVDTPVVASPTVDDTSDVPSTSPVDTPVVAPPTTDDTPVIPPTSNAVIFGTAFSLFALAVLVPF